MERTNLILTVLLLVILFSSVYFEISQANKSFFLFTILSVIGLFLLLTQKANLYVRSWVKNYRLWYQSDEGQISEWPDPRQMGDTIDAKWQVSDVFPAGGYWQLKLKKRTGRLEYLSLECAPVTWDPLRDHDYNNHLKIAKAKIEPRSPAQELNRDKNSGYNSKQTVKDLRKALKDQTGFDPYDTIRKRRGTGAS